MNKLLLLMTFILISNITFSQISENSSKNRLIVKLKPKSNIDLNKVTIDQKFKHNELDKLNKKNKVQSIELSGNKKNKDTYILTFESEQDITNLIKAYENTNLFEYVESDFIGTGGGDLVKLQTIPIDTYFSRQYGLVNNGTFSYSLAKDDADIDMELGWDIEQGDSSVIVAILDSGAKMDHPEFSGRIWNNSKETLNNIDDDNNGYIDDINGWDFVNKENNPTDDHGHGTNIAGIVGANANNGIGYSGIDWNCKLMIGKILDANNSGLYSNWTEAIYYAVDNGAKVINMSVGGSGFSTTMQNAINYAYNKGVTVVACMMNTNNNVTYYPAGYQNTIAVGATNPNDERSSPFPWSATSGSNYGSHIDVVAPGNYIFGLYHLSNTNFNSYWSGTSQAAPAVTGLCSLLLAQNSNRTPDQIRNIVQNTAQDQVGKASEDIVGFDIYSGYGRINARQALLQSSLSTNLLNSDNLNLYIFPNPFTNDININSKIPFKSIIIHNLLGAEIYKKENIENLNFLTLDFSNFEIGLYMISILNENKQIIISKKILKK
ncbi:S8 family serine peptidase [Flavobacterium sp.]|uniref:S8 family serine peptidase n=1 Tax=Flavobacterium sp. TaxID=239 RepID=UPI00286A58D4|nr:S8 family serine peptidase [Flavobacterium sp.]